MGYGTAGWHSSLWSGLLYQQSDDLPSTLTGLTAGAEAGAIGGKYITIPNADQFVAWRAARSIDATLEYALSWRARAAAATTTVTIGILCFDATGAFLGFRRIAIAEPLTTDYSSGSVAIVGEGSGETQFPSGTAWIREYARNHSGAAIRLNQLMLTYG